MDVGRTEIDEKGHTLHDVVAICDQTERDGQRQDRKLPHWDWSLGLCGTTRGPCAVDDSPRPNRVTDIVCAMCERRSTSCDDLQM